ncbi:MAG: lytic transglycosylase domain-containing protein [Deltaproteobacteria bacterium]|nr:lytic transglycosylase domain-containing protein [Deltaproteobacteria bacterium]
MTWVGRRAAVTVVGALLMELLQSVTAGSAAADIYLKRDRYGVLHFTNVPTDKGYQVMMREPLPSSRRPSVGASGSTGSSFVVDSRAFDPIIAEVAGRYQMDRALVKAVIKAESGFQPRAVSPKGARGLMQLMPGTALLHGVRNIHEPSQNIEGGVQHLRMLLDRYGGNVPLALAAYNAGENAVDQHGGIPPFPETRDYVWRVLQFRQQYLQQYIQQAIARGQ